MVTFNQRTSSLSQNNRLQSKLLCLTQFDCWEGRHLQLAEKNSCPNGVRKLKAWLLWHPEYKDILKFL